MPSRIVTKHNPHSGPRQAHLNRTTYNPNRWIKEKDRPKLPSETEATRGCCTSCAHKISWKLKYGKYRLNRDCKQCHHCGGRTVVLAYHTRCAQCAKSTQHCAKCERSLADVRAIASDDLSSCRDEEEEREVESDENDSRQSSDEERSDEWGENMEVLLKTLKERERRVVQRLVMKGAYSKAHAMLRRFMSAQLNAEPDDTADCVMHHKKPAARNEVGAVKPTPVGASPPQQEEDVDSPDDDVIL